MSVSIGNPPVAAVLDGESTIRRHMAAASGRIRRLKQIDRLAVAVITLGGLAVVVSVIGILIFIAAEAYPLFRPATGSLQRTLTFGAAAAPPGAAVLGTDETGRYVYTVTIGGAIAFFAADTGRPLFERIPA